MLYVDKNAKDTKKKETNDDVKYVEHIATIDTEDGDIKLYKQLESENEIKKLNTFGGGN